MKRNRCLTYEEETKLRRTLKRASGDIYAKRDDAWIRFLLTTGMRITEFSRVKVGDARAALTRGYLFVPAAWRKNGEIDLKVTVTAEPAEALRDLLAATSAIAGVPTAKLPDGFPLVISRKLHFLTVRAFQQRTTLWARESGIDTAFSPHWLRHTFAVEYLNGSEGSAAGALVRLKNKLGHKDAHSCMHYLTMSRKDDAEDIGRIFPARKRVSTSALRKEYEGRVGA